LEFVDARGERAVAGDGSLQVSDRDHARVGEGSHRSTPSAIGGVGGGGAARWRPHPTPRGAHDRGSEGV